MSPMMHRTLPQKLLALILLVFVEQALGAQAVPSAAATQAAEQTASGEQATQAAPAAQAQPRVRFETNRGTFDVELYRERSPATVSAFLKLIDARYYDNLIFHRVIANFMIQTGGFDKDLRYREPAETIVNESRNGLSNRRGTLAMARTDDPDSAAGQFFINVRDNERLDGTRRAPGYTVFGKVISGWEVIEEIELADTTGRPGVSEAVPDIPIVILRARRL